MDPPHWDAARRLHGGPDQVASRPHHDWDRHLQHSRYPVDEPNVAQEGLGPPSQDLYRSDVEDPDGEEVQEDEEDPELSRKRKELKEIEDRILHKKVAIALKIVEPIVAEKAPPDEEPSAVKKRQRFQEAPLKERVNALLLQRHPASCLSEDRSPKERLKSSSLRTDCPLKLRVKAIMKQRCSEPSVSPTNMELPDVTPPPPSRSVTSPAGEENSVDMGFQRFLSVLNKGVDMDLFSRIANVDSEDLPFDEEIVQPPASEDRGSYGGERKADRLSRERSLDERLSLPDDQEKKKNDSSGRSRSPSAAKKKKEKKRKTTKEEKEKPKVDEQREQLQNILKTLGFSLKVEEMSKLADRTQERLYGKKQERTSADSKGERDIRQGGAHKHNRKSSSSSSSSSHSSSSSSSRSSSRSSSPSPPRRKRSRSRDSRRRRSSERDRSRDRSRDEPRREDGSRDSGDAQRSRDEDGQDPIYQHPYPQNQTYPHVHPDAFNVPDYSLYHAYHSATYSAAPQSYWTYTPDATSPPLYPNGYPYPPNTYHHFPAPAAPPNMVYPQHHPLEDVELFMNPDLSQSEGQMGSTSGPRCLQVIDTKPTNQSCLRQLTRSRKKRKRGNPETLYKKKLERSQKKKELKKQRKKEARQQLVTPLKTVEGDKNDPEPEQSEEEKPPPTEEEIKANLRKKLEAFNQRVKQKVSQPAN